MTRTEIVCGLGKTRQQEHNAHGINKARNLAMTPDQHLERAVRRLWSCAAGAGRQYAPAALFRLQWAAAQAYIR